MAGVVVLGGATAIADKHPVIDRRLFALVNHGGGESLLLRVVQQAGTPWILPIVAAGATLAGRRRLAAAAALALPVKKTLEVGIKKARPTPRPLYVEPTVLRDDAPVEGESFPSGHAAIAFAAATLVRPSFRSPGALLSLLLPRAPPSCASPKARTIRWTRWRGPRSEWPSGGTSLGDRPMTSRPRA